MFGLAWQSKHVIAILLAAFGMQSSVSRRRTGTLMAINLNSLHDEQACLQIISLNFPYFRFSERPPN